MGGRHDPGAGSPPRVVDLLLGVAEMRHLTRGLEVRFHRVFAGKDAKPLGMERM